MSLILDILDSLVLAVCLPLSGWRLLHYFQLESYQLPGYYRSLRRNAQKVLPPCLALAALGVVLTVLGAPAPVRIIAVAAFASVLERRARKEKAKKPFVVTERVKRLIAMHAATAFAAVLLVRAVLPLTIVYLLPALEAALIAFAAVCAQPIEKHINQQAHQ